MFSFNQIMIGGFLGKDPEFKMSQTNIPYTTFSVAVKRKFSKKNETDWFDITIFGKKAEVVKDNFKKGDPIFIIGRLEISNFETDGVKHRRVNIVASDFEFVEKSIKKEETDEKEPYTKDFIDDEIPF